MLLCVSCGDDSGTATPADTAPFCNALVEAFAADVSADGGDRSPDAALDGAFALAPAELSDVVATLRSADEENLDSPYLDALQDLTLWAGDHCGGDQPTRRVGPPTVPDGFVGCGDSAALPLPSTEKPNGSLVIYGDARSPDPYGGRIVAVVTGILMGPGDAPRTDVTVNGIAAVTGPAGVFQGGGGPATSRVVAWTLDGHDVTVFGRGYADTDAAALVAVAEEVEIVDGQAVAPSSALDVLYQGPADPLSATVPFFMGGADYSLTYRRSDGGGQLDVVGLKMTAETFAATRAFFSSSTLRTFSRGEGFVADAWNETGPFVAAWHEPDDLVVWIVGLGIDKEQTVAAADAATELGAAQWKQTSRFSPACLTDPGDTTTTRS
jgi:hypothetical protein